MCGQRIENIDVTSGPLSSKTSSLTATEFDDGLAAARRWGESIKRCRSPIGNCRGPLILREIQELGRNRHVRHRSGPCPHFARFFPCLVMLFNLLKTLPNRIPCICVQHDWRISDEIE